MSNSSYDLARQSFLDQFETDGDCYLYRSRQLGQGIAVSAHERDVFLACFKRDMGRLKWIGGGLLLLLLPLAGIISLTIDMAGYEVSVWWVGPPLILYLGVMIRLARRAWTAPLRALGTRSHVGEHRSRSEEDRRKDVRLAWSLLPGLAIMLAPFIIDKWFPDLLPDWFWPCWIVVAIVIHAVATAVRKWQNRRS